MVDDKRRGDRAFDAKRRAAHPYLAWYRTQRWRRRAKAQLAAEPFCRFCAKVGQRVAASIADHIEPHRGDAVRFWSGKLQSLCRHHHSSVKQSMERGDRAGCDVTGMPTDPGHPWAN